LHAAVEYGAWRAAPLGEYVEVADADPPRAERVVEHALDRLGDEGGWMDPDGVVEVLEAYGLRVPRSRVVSTEDEAVEAAADLPGTAVLKVVSDEAVHKSDVGGIALDVSGTAAVSAAYREVTSAVGEADGVLVQEFVEGGHEILIGMVEDPTFGPLVAFGLGGVFVELIGDVAFRVHPLTDLDVVEMVRDVKSARLLDGYRGGEPGDVPAVHDALLRVSALVEDLPEVVEMDLNPVKVGPPGTGLHVVDARIRVRPVKRSWNPTRRHFPSAL
jgi:acyl-CoA synthetase (NDP forming)